MVKIQVCSVHSNISVGLDIEDYGNFLITKLLH